MIQSPKLPALNALDPFFWALHSKQWSNGHVRTVDQLMDTVLLALDEVHFVKLNFGWLTLMSCFDDVINCHGDNDYAILHMQKEKRLCDGTLPNLLIPSDVALEVFDMMRVHENNDGVGRQQ
jgi:hypothetical protein